MQTQRPRRVLHLLKGMQRGGIENWLMAVLRRADWSKIQFDFLVEERKECTYDQEIRDMGGQILRGPPYKNRLGVAAKLCEVLARKGPYDIVHVHGRHNMAVAVTPARLMRVPIRIGHVHNCDETTNDSPAKALYKRATKHALLRDSTWVLGCSQFACDSMYGEDLARSHPKVQVLLYGIDLEPFRGLDTRAQLLAELDLPGESKLIGHVGRFVAKKNHRLVVKIFAELHRRDPTCRLVLVGDGELREMITGQLGERGLLPYTRFMGVRSDIPEIMRGLDVFLFPSVVEGLGIVLIEAQATGLPCVVSETVPAEASIDRDISYTVQLSDPVAKWADVVLEAARKERQPDRSWQVVNASSFNVENTVRTLLHDYYRID